MPVLELIEYPSPSTVFVRLVATFACAPSATFKIVLASPADNISGTPELPEVRPMKLSVAIFANLARVTFSSVIFVVTIAFDANVVVIEIAAEPSKLAEPVTSPATAIARVVANVVAVPAFPLTEPTIVVEKVFAPAIVSFPVSMTAPAAVTDAVSITPYSIKVKLVVSKSMSPTFES